MTTWRYKISLLTFHELVILACTKTWNAGTPEGRNAGTPERPKAGTPERRNTKTRNTKLLKPGTHFS